MTSLNLFFFHSHVMACGLANSAFLFVVLKKLMEQSYQLSSVILLFVVCTESKGPPIG